MSDKFHEQYKLPLVLGAVVSRKFNFTTKANNKTPQQVYTVKVILSCHVFY